jgi:hypothetical protein
VNGLDSALATLAAAHAELCTGFAARMARRIAPARAVALYARHLELTESEARHLRGVVRRSLGARCGEWSAGDGVMRFRDWLRSNSAPWGDPALTDIVRTELAWCERAIAGTARRVVTRQSSRDAALALLGRLPLSAAVQSAVYGEVLARTAAVSPLRALRPARPPRRLAAHRV